MEKEQLKKVKGNVDNPIKTYTNDRLSLKAQIDGLAHFIQSCETPMTISVQGAWGSGKTSFFNMVKDKIQQEDKAKNCVFEEFNSWQFVQFDMSEHLAENMVIALTNQMDKSTPKEFKENKNNVGKVINGMELLKAGGRLFANVANDWAKEKYGVDVKEELEDAGFLDGDKLLKKKETRPKTAVEVVSELRKDFNEVVNNRLGIKEKDKATASLEKRIVFFVDDLDRLAPDKAIEVLEVLKMFLDCERCVFVLAIDYNVVVNGVSLKYKNSIGAAKGAEFFEKMIQVVYTLPDTLAHTDRYIAEILKNNGMNISLSHEFTDLVKSGKRDNPRAIKRLMNSYLLLETMRKEAYSAAGEKKESGQHEKILLFAVLCLQNICPEVYAYLYEKFSFPYDYEKGTRWFNEFKNFCYHEFHKSTQDLDVREEFESLVKDEYTNKISQTKLGFLNTFFEKLLIDTSLFMDYYEQEQVVTIFHILELEKTIKLAELTRVRDDNYSNNDSVAVVKIDMSVMYTREGTIEEAYKMSLQGIMSAFVYRRQELGWMLDLESEASFEEVVEHFKGFMSLKQPKEKGWEIIAIEENNQNLYIKVPKEDATAMVKNVVELSEYVKVSLVWFSNLSGSKKLVEGYNVVEDVLRFEGKVVYYIQLNDSYSYVKGHSLRKAYYDTVASIIASLPDNKIEKVIEEFDFLSFECAEEMSYDEEYKGEEYPEDPFYEKYGEWRWAATATRIGQIDYYIHVDGFSESKLVGNACKLSEFCKINFCWYGDPYMSEKVVRGFKES